MPAPSAKEHMPNILTRRELVGILVITFRIILLERIFLLFAVSIKSKSDALEVLLFVLILLE